MSNFNIITWLESEAATLGLNAATIAQILQNFGPVALHMAIELLNNGLTEQEVLNALAELFAAVNELKNKKSK